MGPSVTAHELKELRDEINEVRLSMDLVRMGGSDGSEDSYKTSFSSQADCNPMGSGEVANPSQSNAVDTPVEIGAAKLSTDLRLGEVSAQHDASISSLSKAILDQILAMRTTGLRYFASTPISDQPTSSPTTRDDALWWAWSRIEQAHVMQSPRMNLSVREVQATRHNMCVNPNPTHGMLGRLSGERVGAFGFSGLLIARSEVNNTAVERDLNDKIVWAGAPILAFEMKELTAMLYHSPILEGRECQSTWADDSGQTAATLEQPQVVTFYIRILNDRFTLFARPDTELRRLFAVILFRLPPSLRHKSVRVIEARSLNDCNQ
jgi:hypothetical protein